MTVRGATGGQWEGARSGRGSCSRTGRSGALGTTPAVAANAIIIDPDATVRALAKALRSEGLHVEESVGGSSFRCDLAVRRKGDTSHRLAVLVDTDAHYAAPSDERHRVKPSLLRAFGWRLEVVLAKDWREAPSEVLARVRSALDDAS